MRVSLNLTYHCRQYQMGEGFSEMVTPLYGLTVSSISDHLPWEFQNKQVSETWGSLIPRYHCYLCVSDLHKPWNFNSASWGPSKTYCHWKKARRGNWRHTLGRHKTIFVHRDMIVYVKNLRELTKNLSKLINCCKPYCRIKDHYTKDNQFPLYQQWTSRIWNKEDNIIYISMPPN